MVSKLMFFLLVLTTPIIAPGKVGKQKIQIREQITPELIEILDEPEIISKEEVRARAKYEQDLYLEWQSHMTDFKPSDILSAILEPGDTYTFHFWSDGQT